MSHRARANVGRLLLVFVLAIATPSVRAQSEAISVPAATSRPAGSFDARPFRKDGTLTSSSSSSSGGFAASQPARATGADVPSLGFDVGRMFASLVIVLALIGLAYWFARRLIGRHAGATSTRAVKVLSRTPLAPRQQVLLLQVGRRVIVVGESAGQLASLAQIDDADEVAQLLGQIEGEQMRKAASFGGVFRRSQTSFDEPAAAEPSAEPDAHFAPPAEVGDLDRQRTELSGLLDKVRALRGQIDK